jgi:hypothetical protein
LKLSGHVGIPKGSRKSNWRYGVTATVRSTIAARTLHGGRRAEAWCVRCDRNARDISFRKNGIRDSLQSKVGEGFRVGRGGRSLRDRPALAGRALDSREFGRGGFEKGKIIGAAAKPLISLETAKENVWNSLEKAWKSLEFPWKSLDFPWKGLEKFGRVGPAAATPSCPRSSRSAA